MTKTIKKLLALALIFSFLLAATGCYVVQSQKMRDLKGTYKLTTYTYTPKYERKEGYTPKSKDYINGEEYMYEDYLVITGEGKGYYVTRGTYIPITWKKESYESPTKFFTESGELLLINRGKTFISVCPTSIASSITFN